MTCQDCNEKEANVIFTQIMNGEKQVFHLCKACADQRCGQAGETKCDEKLTSWPVEAGDEDLICPECGRSLVDFKQCGRFGCAACYSACAEQLGVIMKRIHGAPRHSFPSPDACDSEQERLAALKECLREAVAGEAYEEAARLRDQIDGLSS